MFKFPCNFNTQSLCCFEIQEKLSLNCVSSSAVQELMRGIRLQLNSLITGNRQINVLCFVSRR